MIRRATEVKSEEVPTESTDEGGQKRGEIYEVQAHCTVCAKHIHKLTNVAMQVELVKPLGIRFARGSDGGAYVTRSDPNLGNTDKMVQVYVPPVYLPQAAHL